jgi:hypothetical protein
VPNCDIAANSIHWLFDQFVGDSEQCGKYFEAPSLGPDFRRRVRRWLRLVVDSELLHI